MSGIHKRAISGPVSLIENDGSAISMVSNLSEFICVPSFFNGHGPLKFKFSGVWSTFTTQFGKMNRRM